MIFEISRHLHNFGCHEALLKLASIPWSQAEGLKGFTDNYFPLTYNSRLIVAMLPDPTNIAESLLSSMPGRILVDPEGGWVQSLPF